MNTGSLKNSIENEKDRPYRSRFSVLFFAVICKDQLIISLFADGKPVFFSADKFHACFFQDSA